MNSRPYGQDDVLNAFGTVSDECTTTGDTDDPTQTHLPYYVVPYLDGTPKTYTSIPRLPYVIPNLKLTVTTDFYDEHECLRSPLAIKRREPGTYVINEDLRELVNDIEVSVVEPPIPTGSSPADMR